MNKDLEPVYRMLGAKVAQLRVALGWKQEDLALSVSGRCGASGRRVWKVPRTNSTPSPPPSRAPRRWRGR